MSKKFVNINLIKSKTLTRIINHTKIRTHEVINSIPPTRCTDNHPSGGVTSGDHKHVVKNAEFGLVVDRAYFLFLAALGSSTLFRGGDDCKTKGL